MERTIIAYIAADNNLSDVVSIDIEEMKEGYREIGVNLIVLMDTANATSCLLKITENGEQTIKTYQEFNSADPATMNKLLREIAEMYPSESYGLILWSHGTSWLPAGVQLKSFAADGNRQMNIPDLAEALPLFHIGETENI
jgi:cell division protein ZapA (FtsZ GTPase activity inhibitor)